jgi:hypothetical protein
VQENTPGKSQNLFIFLSVTLSLTFSIAIAEWVLRYQRQSIDQEIKYSEQMDQGMIQYDAQFGWNWSGRSDVGVSCRPMAVYEGQKKILAVTDSAGYVTAWCVTGFRAWL